MTELAPTDGPLRVALVNDYEIIVEGLRSLLAPFAGRVRIVEEEVGGAPGDAVDIALFDTFGGRRDAVARAARMAEERHARHVVLYTWDATAELVESARSVGVSGVLLKTSDGAELVDALEQIVDGERPGLDRVGRRQGADRSDPLSMREQEVLALLALGWSNAQIAAELYLSIDTVKTYVRRVFRKLRVRNRTQAALLADQYGLAPPTARLERARQAPSSSDPSCTDPTGPSMGSG